MRISEELSEESCYVIQSSTSKNLAYGNRHTSRWTTLSVACNRKKKGPTKEEDSTEEKLLHHREKACFQQISGCQE